MRYEPPNSFDDETFYRFIDSERYRQVMLRAISLRVGYAITGDVLHSRGHRMLDALADGFVAEFVLSLSGKRRQVKQQVFEPSTWWDAFKLAHFPEVILNAYPARLKPIDVAIEQVFVCPHTEALPPNRHIVFIENERFDEEEYLEQLRYAAWKKLPTTRYKRVTLRERFAAWARINLMSPNAR